MISRSPAAPTVSLPSARRRDTLARWLAASDRVSHTATRGAGKRGPRLHLFSPGPDGGIAIIEVDLTAVARATVRLRLAETPPYPVLRRPSGRDAA